MVIDCLTKSFLLKEVLLNFFLEPKSVMIRTEVKGISGTARGGEDMLKSLFTLSCSVK